MTVDAYDLKKRIVDLEDGGALYDIECPACRSVLVVRRNGDIIAGNCADKYCDWYGDPSPIEDIFPDLFPKPKPAPAERPSKLKTSVLDLKGIPDWDAWKVGQAYHDPDSDPPTDAPDLTSKAAREIYAALMASERTPQGRKDAIHKATKKYANQVEIMQWILKWKDKPEPKRPEPIQPTRMKMSELRRTKFPPARFIIEKLIPVGLTIMCGKSNTRKSWTVLEMAHAVAQGKPFWGRTTENGPVLMYALEDSFSNIQDRCVIQGQPEDVDVETIIDLEEKERKDLPGNLEKHIRDTGAKMVIIDTLSTYLRATDQNSPEQMTEVLSRLQRIALNNGCATVVVHHARKGGGDLDMYDDGDWYDEFRGSTAIVNSADCKIFIAAKRGRGETEARLKAGGRLLKDEEDLRLNWDAENARYDVDGDWHETRLNMREDRIIAALREMGGSAGSMKELAEHVGLSITNISRDIKELRDRGVIIQATTGTAAKKIILRDIY